MRLPNDGQHRALSERQTHHAIKTGVQSMIREGKAEQRRHGVEPFYEVYSKEISNSVRLKRHRLV